MYVVEKIGDLILISVEKDMTEDDYESIKEKLKKLASVAIENVVISIYCPLSKVDKEKNIETEINKLLKYCDEVGLRVYSYKY